MRKQKITLLIIVLCAAFSFAKVDLQIQNQDLVVGLSGTAWQESGQFVDFYNGSVELYHQWINRTYLDLILDVKYKERLQMTMGLEGEMWFNIPKLRGTGQATYVHQQNSTYIVSDANASYSLGNLNLPYLSAKAGLFRYKYNQESRDLGEYLFRTGTYPAYVINVFDRPFDRLTGLMFSSDLANFLGSLHQDLIFSMETTIPPFNDISITYLADCNLQKMVDFGAGVQFANVLTVDKSQRSAHIDKNKYVTANGDTGWYTFLGTKLMAKICVDPKEIVNKFVNIDNIFGKEDLKLYSEAAILGLESYPKNDSVTASGTGGGKNYWGYDTLKNKIPVMFGFNIPTFKILDVFALEAEWYGCPYPNSYKNRLGPGSTPSYPVPDAPVHLAYADYASDNWKWAVYLKKSFLEEHIDLVLMFARDHVRNETLVNESYDYEEALSKNSQWYWMAKFVFKF